MTALYIHTPFCTSKCPYCSFVSFAGMEIDLCRYVRAMQAELEGISSRYDIPVLQSLFFGGGTPTFLASEHLAGLLDSCSRLFHFDSSIEISVEANPGTVDLSYFRDLYKAGVNRISIGIQSFSECDLKILGRGHSREDALRAIEQAHKAGFENVSLDLMYGIPGQTCESWITSLETALACTPRHLSCYQLTIEEGTPYSAWMKAGKLQLPDEEVIEQMDLQTVELCAQAGLAQYEISNFAAPGRECRQNITYWQNRDYYAAGAGAVSCLAGRRERREENPLEYCRRIEQGKEAVTASECLDAEASFRESVVMGLRMVAGVCRRDLFDRYNIDLDTYYGEILDRLWKNDLIERTPTHLRLTPRGRQVANSVMAELV